MATTGDRIRELRENLGWTQEQLASKAKLSKGFLSDVENNKRDLSTTNVLKIANAMGASLDYLLRGETTSLDERREPVHIPPSLSEAAMELGLSYAETLMLLETHQSVVARRSDRSQIPPGIDDWKELYFSIRKLYPE